MFHTLIHFLVSKDLAVLMLPDAVREEVIRDLTRMSSESALEALKVEVPGEKRAEFNTLFEMHNESKIEVFLKSTVPHFQEIVTAITKEELEKFKHAFAREQSGQQ